MSNKVVGATSSEGISRRAESWLKESSLTSGYAMVVHGRPKTPKIQVFGGHPAPRGNTAPIF